MKISKKALAFLIAQGALNANVFKEMHVTESGEGSLEFTSKKTVGINCLKDQEAQTSTVIPVATGRFMKENGFFTEDAEKRFSTSSPFKGRNNAELVTLQTIESTSLDAVFAPKKTVAAEAEYGDQSK